MSTETTHIGAYGVLGEEGKVIMKVGFSLISK